MHRCLSGRLSGYICTHILCALSTVFFPLSLSACSPDCCSPLIIGESEIDVLQLVVTYHPASGTLGHQRDGRTAFSFSLMRKLLWDELQAPRRPPRTQVARTLESMRSLSRGCHEGCSLLLRGTGFLTRVVDTARSAAGLGAGGPQHRRLAPPGSMVFLLSLAVWCWGDFSGSPSLWSVI